MPSSPWARRLRQPDIWLLAQRGGEVDHREGVSLVVTSRDHDPSRVESDASCCSSLRPQASGIGGGGWPRRRPVRREPRRNLRIYLNLPEGQPDYTSDYYVGNLGFFGMEAGGHGEGGHGHPANLSFDVRDNVRALKAKGSGKNEKPT